MADEPLSDLPVWADAAIPHGKPHSPAVLGAMAAGAALGGICRLAVAHLVPTSSAGFPWATLWTNLSGSFALGLLLALAVRRFPHSRFLLPFFGPGFLGAYTTFSTFAAETSLLWAKGQVQLAAAYTGLSMTAGLLAAGLGISLARHLYRITG